MKGSGRFTQKERQQAWAKVREEEKNNRLVSKKDMAFFDSPQIRNEITSEFEGDVFLAGGDGSDVKIGQQFFDKGVGKEVDQCGNHRADIFAELCKTGDLKAKRQGRAFLSVNWIPQFHRWLRRQGFDVGKLVRLNASPVVGIDTEFGLSVKMCGVSTKRGISVEVAKVEGTRGVFVSVRRLRAADAVVERAFPTLIAAKNFIKANYCFDAKKEIVSSMADVL